MTTLRRALSSPIKGASLKALAALLCAGLLLTLGQPALAASTHGGGGGGHAGGGHASGGHGGGVAHPIGGGHYYGPYRGGYGGRGYYGGRGWYGGRGFYGGAGWGGWGFGLGLGLGLGFAWDYPWYWGPGYYGYYGYGWGSPYYYADPYYYGYQAPAAPPADDDGYSPGGNDNGDGGNGGNGGASGTNPAPRPMAAPGRDGRGEMGAINLDLSPGDAQVYLNQQYIGRVRDFGGWQHGYLWLKEGTYDIAFYKEGYKTLARQVTIYPGLIITWDDKMEPGQAIRPEDLPTKSHVRRDARIQFERDRAAQIDANAAPAPMAPNEPPPYSGGDSWRDRVDQDRANGSAQPQSNVQPAAPVAGRAVVAADSASLPPSGANARYGHLHLKVDPGDAWVYLDGHLVGTGSDLAGDSSGLVIAPGHHKLSVARPGRQAKERDFDASTGNDVNLTISLAPVTAQ